MSANQKYYRPAIVFEETHPPKEPEVELTAQLQFEESNVRFALANLDKEREKEAEEAEEHVEAVIKPKKKHWLLPSLVLSGLGLSIWQTLDNLITAIFSGDLLALGWAIFSAVIISFLSMVFGKEIKSLYRLDKRKKEKEIVNNLIEIGGISQSKPTCESLAVQMNLQLTEGYDKWYHSVSTTHNDKDVFELFDAMVMKEQDIAVQKIIAKTATESAIMVALSPLAIVDVLLVAWRNFRLINKISEIYGVRLGIVSRGRLIRLVFANMAIAGASEAITGLGTDLLSVDLVGKLSSAAAQGLGVGLLTARLGYKAMSLMRPLPYLASSEPKLSDMRKHLLSVLTTKN